MPRPVPRPLTIVWTVVLGAIMVPIDATIVNVAITKLAAATGASLPVIQWVSTGYALALASVLPVAAWLINRFTARTVYLAAVALFALGSALVALSWNAESLIAFRILQGLAGGVVTPATMTLVIGSAPPQERGRVMALLGLPLMLGPILAPVLGGWLLDVLSWRWLFLINLPLGALAVALCRRNIPPAPAGPAGRLDWIGLGLLPPAMALLVLGTSQITPGTIPVTTVLSFAAGLALIIAFVVHARRSTAPLLDLRLLATRVTGGTTAVLFLYTGATMAGLILMPLYWQVARGQTALQTGLLMAPAAVAAAAVIRTSGRFIDQHPPLAVIGGGIMLSTLAQAALALGFEQQAPTWVIATLWAVRSVGTAFTIMPASTTAVRHLTGPQVPAGTTLLQVTAQIAAAACVAVVSVLLSARLSTHLPAGLDNLPTLTALSPNERAPLAAPLSAAFADVSWLPTALMAASALLAVLVIRGIPAPATQQPSAAPPAPAPVSGGTAGGNQQAGAAAGTALPTPGAAPPK